MKNYPRIHSLSTVGLIHHQENDYLLHHTRTDFIGDSGSGKSIIADLLQLIFIGSSAFKSATATLREKRNPDGLVLTSSGKGSNMGYAFLNIESAEEQYITIGAYFENTAKGTKPFIVQTSTEIENGKLVPMQHPLKASDFKDGKSIYDLEELTEAFDDKELVFKKWDRISYYHRVLYNNNILPLDLASSDKALNDYAKIIQSFSRGRTLNTQKSKSLLDFLFGQVKSNELYTKYSSIVKELENTILSYGQNLEAIKLLTNKYQKICSLKELLERKNSKEQKYLTNELLFQRDEFKRLSGKLAINTEKIINAYNSLKQLVDATKQDIKVAQKDKEKVNEDVEITLELYTGAKQNFDHLVKALKLLEEIKLKENELESFYRTYKSNKQKSLILNELTAKLSEKDLLGFFERSEWIKGIRNGTEYYGCRTNEIKEELTNLHLLAEYSDVDNPDSLVRWAISLDRPLTPIEESLVVHFQTLKRNEPKQPIKRDKFLPFPEILFHKPEIEERDGGFWINLNGIREFVDNVTEQKLNIDDKDKIKEYFNSQVLDTKKEIERLEKEQRNLNNLNVILLDLSNAEQSVMVYRQREELDNFEEIKQLEDIGEESINLYLASLKRNEVIRQEFKQYKQDYEEALAKQNENRILLEKLPAKIEKAEKSLECIKSSEKFLVDIAKQFSIPKPKNEDLSFYFDSDDKADTFQTEFNIQNADLELASSLPEDKTAFDSFKEELKQKELDYISRFPEVQVHNDINVLITEQSVQKNREEFIEEKVKYIKEFDDIVGEFISNESYRFEGENKDFVNLVSYLLPDIFGYGNVIEEEVIGKIRNHLEQINNKNRDLNSKKIRKIEDLLDDVHMAVGEQIDVIRKINRFFSNGEKSISGNYQLNLVCNDVKEFPISWLSDFKNKASEQLNLFNVSIADKLSVFISIEEKILHAFSSLTDNNNSDITIQELLDPNSYIELSLEMKDVRGKSNKGSTGQTYAAIALLCIARLSIVGNRNLKKEEGIRFMPIDEAEGLGSNFDLLYEIAQKHDYQIFTFSINPLGRYDEQYIYILHRNPDADVNINFTPMAIRSKTDIRAEIVETVEQ